MLCILAGAMDAGLGQFVIEVAQCRCAFEDHKPLDFDRVKQLFHDDER